MPMSQQLTVQLSAPYYGHNVITAVHCRESVCHASMHVDTRTAQIS